MSDEHRTDETRATLGDILKKARSDLNMSQRDVENATGIAEGGRTRLLLHEDGVGWLELGPRGWQRVVPVGELDEVRMRLGVAA